MKSCLTSSPTLPYPIEGDIQFFLPNPAPCFYLSCCNWLLAGGERRASKQLQAASYARAIARVSGKRESGSRHRVSCSVSSGVSQDASSDGHSGQFWTIRWTFSHNCIQTLFRNINLSSILYIYIYIFLFIFYKFYYKLCFPCTASQQYGSGNYCFTKNTSKGLLPTLTVLKTNKLR